MRILFYGDSITDMGRDLNARGEDYRKGLGLGYGYVSFVAAELLTKHPNGYEFINRGISGNRSVDLYARIKADCWNLKPDVVSILVGINDVYPQELENNAVELDRYEKIYRMMIEDTKAKLPDVKMILCEPFMLADSANENDIVKWTCNPGVKEYAATVRKLATEYDLAFVALQEPLEKAAAGHADCFVFDGIHPTPAGAKIIANEWMKVFTVNCLTA